MSKNENIASMYSYFWIITSHVLPKTHHDYCYLSERYHYYKVPRTERWRQQHPRHQNKNDNDGKRIHAAEI